MDEVVLGKIKGVASDFLEHMSVAFSSIDAELSVSEPKEGSGQSPRQAITLNIVTENPQMLIGQNGQTLLDLQRVIGLIAQKKLSEPFYLKLDINSYKKKKLEYVRRMALEIADEVASTGQKRVLPPMSSYERMVVHAGLAGRQDVQTESQGDGLERSVVILPK